MVKSDKGYLIDCERDFIEELLNILERYKLQSKVVIEDVSSKHVVGIISKEKFLELKKVKCQILILLNIDQAHYLWIQEQTSLGQE